MRRNLRRTIAFAAAVFLLAGGVSAGAEEDGDGAAAFSGYLFRLKEDAPATVSLMAEDGESGISAVLPERDIYKADDMQTLAQYIEMDWVEYVEPNYYVELYDSYPDDPHYQNGDQWQMDAIGMQYAWDRGIDGSGVVIGIIDSGYYWEHPDLQNQNIKQGNSYIGKEPTADTNDTYGHGTMVTGFIGASTNNSVGVAGIAPGATIIPMKTFDEKKGPIDAVIRAIEAGVSEHHCDIISMSFGVYKEKLDKLGQSSDLVSLEAAIDYADEAGVIMVAAAGNDYGRIDTDTNIDLTGLKSYPASFDSVISVASMDQRLCIAYSSQKNDQVWVSAPGVKVYSTEKGGGYSSGNGTSYATPMVSAVAALAKQVYPALTSQQFMDLLKETSIPLDGADWTDSYGYGRISIPDLFGELRKVMPPRTFWDSEDGTLTLSVSYPAIADDRSALVIAAAYNGVGRMMSANQQKTTTGLWGPEVRALSFDISKGGISKVRVFLADPDTYEPLSEVITIPVA